MLGMTWARTLDGALDEISRLQAEREQRHGCAHRAGVAASRARAQRAPHPRTPGLDVKYLAGAALGITAAVVWLRTWRAFLGWALSRGDTSARR